MKKLRAERIQRMPAAIWSRPSVLTCLLTNITIQGTVVLPVSETGVKLGVSH